MIAEIKPARLKGIIQAPPSKSMGHRMMICAALANGISHIEGISDSEDMHATLDALTALGVSCTKKGSAVEIRGTDLRKAKPAASLACRESGSTLRFMIPLCMVSDEAAAKDEHFTLTGSPRLMERPQSVYEEICVKQKLTFIRKDGAIEVGGKLSAGVYEIAGNISSQFITGLLFTLPLLDSDSILSISEPIESRSYIDMTIAALALFGIRVNWSDHHTISIAGNQQYTPADISVEGDYSNTAFFEALPCLGHDVSVTGLNENSLQGDRIYRTIFPQIASGCPTVHIGDCPDLGPIFMALAAAKHGITLTGTKRLKIKESDRGTAMAAELAKFGVRAELEEDTIRVIPEAFHAPDELLHGHNDHRIVMALATLLTVTGGRIDDAQAVSKSLPDYFTLLNSLGAEAIIK